MIRNIFLLMLSALCAWSCTDNLPGDEAPTDGRHSLNITVGPKPAFTDGTLTRADGTPLAQTRVAQTDDATKWEEGDVVWLYATFQDAVGNIGTFYSALKYTDTTWCYLTKAEAGEMGLNNDNSFNRIILPDGYTVIDVLGYYAGNGKPGKNGLITIPAPSSDTSVPVMEASGERSIQGDSWSFSFTYCCSRLRIPAGYRVQMANYRYYASYDLPGGDLNIKTAAIPLDLPAADAPRDIFLLPVADDQGTPAPITLTRNDGATWTFTPQPATTSASDYYGQSYILPDLGNGSVTPGGM